MSNIEKWLGIRKKEKPRKNIITLPFNKLNEANTAKEVAELMLKTKREFLKKYWNFLKLFLHNILSHLTTGNTIYSVLVGRNMYFKTRC